MYLFVSFISALIFQVSSQTINLETNNLLVLLIVFTIMTYGVLLDIKHEIKEE